MQKLVQRLGGVVEKSEDREYGRAHFKLEREDPLFEGLPGGRVVWMSHGDRVLRLPPGFRVLGTSESSPFAAVRHEIAPDLGPALPPRGRAHGRRRRAARELRAAHLRSPRELDDGGVRRPGDRPGARAGGRGHRGLRPLGRRRFHGRGRAGAARDRLAPALHLRRQRPAAAGRARAGRAALPRQPRDRPGHGARRAALPLGAARGHRPRAQAPADRAPLHRDLRRAGREAGRRGLPGAGDALSGRDRERLGEGPLGHHQDPSQRRRAAGAHAPAAGRAAARAVQGRGPGGGAPPRAPGERDPAAPVPGARPRDPRDRRGHAGASRDAARGRRDRDRGGAPRGALRRALAGLRGLPPDPERRA